MIVTGGKQSQLLALALGLGWSLTTMGFGKPSKLETGKTWEKFPTGGGGQKKFTKFPSFTWEIFQNRGGVKNFHKVPKFIKKGVKRA